MQERGPRRYATDASVPAMVARREAHSDWSTPDFGTQLALAAHLRGGDTSMSCALSHPYAAMTDATMITDDDATLLERYRTLGDSAAFAELSSRHRDVAVRVARAVLGDAEAAEDVAQEALLLAMAGATSFSGQGSVRAWIAAIAANAARMRRRAEQTRRRHEEQAANVPPNEPCSDIDGDAVWSAVQRLPEPVQEVVLLRFRAGLEVSEIARHLGLSRFAVHKRQRQALASLRRMLPIGGVALLALLAAPLPGETALPVQTRSLGKCVILSAAIVMVMLGLFLIGRHHWSFASPSAPTRAMDAAQALSLPPLVDPPNPPVIADVPLWHKFPADTDMIVVVNMKEGKPAIDAPGDLTQELVMRARTLTIGSRQAHSKYWLCFQGPGLWTAIGNKRLEHWSASVGWKLRRHGVAQAWDLHAKGDFTVQAPFVLMSPQHDEAPLSRIQLYAHLTPKPAPDDGTYPAVIIALDQDTVIVCGQDIADELLAVLSRDGTEPLPLAKELDALPTDAWVRLVSHGSPAPDDPQLKDIVSINGAILRNGANIGSGTKLHMRIRCLTAPAAQSLLTTGQEYLQFARTCMKNPEFRNQFAQQLTFIPEGERGRKAAALIDGAYTCLDQVVMQTTEGDVHIDANWPDFNLEEVFEHLIRGPG